MTHFGQVFFHHSNVEFGIFKTKLINYFIANDVKDEDKKKAILITCLSDETYKLLIRICLPKDPETLTYNVLLQNLEKHFSPKKCYFVERKRFYQASQEAQESVREFAARLQSLAASCKFGRELDVILRDIFVIGLTSKEVLERLKEAEDTNLDVSFEKVVDLAALKEITLTREAIDDCKKLDIKKDGMKISQQPWDSIQEKPGHKAQQVRSWWIDLAAKCAVFLLMFFLMNHMLGCSQTSSLFALAATYIMFYV